jgi:diguanylate cyclase (GGDEF)-like protein
MTDVLLADFTINTDQAVILVVDDQPINIQVIYQVLGSHYKILMATSGAQAIKVCSESMPDLVLMDVIMPEQDGLETCRLMKANPDIADIPVIFVTSVQQQEEEDACWEAGAVDFIQKPFNASTLRHRVKVHLTLKQQSDLLRSLAFVDGLTSVYNRRYFDQSLLQQLASCKRQKAPLALLIIDIDHFKLFNDQLGHLAGDDALRQVAKALKASCARQQDFIARYGGEEFVAILPDTDAAGAVIMAKKMLEKVQALQIVHPATALGTVSISIGIAIANITTGYSSDITARADKQLYLTKQQGRNGYRLEEATLPK